MENIITLTVSESFITLAVKPAADDDFPDVYTHLGRKPCTYFKNCDFAQDGSPTIHTFKSPLNEVPSFVFL